MDRKIVLQKATELSYDKKDSDYGSSADNFARIAKFWNAYLGDNVCDSKDVAMMMGLVEISCARANPTKVDSYINLAAYAACGGDFAEVQDHIKNK